MRPIAPTAKLSSSFFLFFSLLALPGCNFNPMDEFVDQTVSLDFRAVEAGEGRPAAAGEVTFTHYSTYMDHVTICERVECGSDYQEDCRMERSCGIVAGGGRECHETPVCSGYSTPRYCDTNCEIVPVTRTAENKTRSPVQVTIKAPAGVALRHLKISSLYLGVQTNESFRLAFANPAMRPEKVAGLFDFLKPEDRTLLIMKAKGFRLVSGQEFLKVAEGFVRGDTVNVEVEVERANTDKTVVSAVGTSVGLPQLKTGDY